MCAAGTYLITGIFFINRHFGIYVHLFSKKTRYRIFGFKIEDKCEMVILNNVQFYIFECFSFFVSLLLRLIQSEFTFILILR